MIIVIKTFLFASQILSVQVKPSQASAYDCQFSLFLFIFGWERAEDLPAAASHALGAWAQLSSALQGPESQPSPLSSPPHSTTLPLWLHQALVTHLTFLSRRWRHLLDNLKRKNKEQISGNLQPPAFQEACSHEVSG